MRHADPIALLDRLVGFQTISRHDNLALIDWIADYLRSQGVQPVVIPSASGGQANLFASLGPPGDGGIVLSGHTDVVPVDGQDWSSDPFTLVARDGAYYGRGTADMKGFIALALAMVPELQARRLARPIHLAFSYDEEVGCLGVPDVIARLGRTLPRPEIVVVGEPTGLRPANSHKGCYFYETTVTGREAHSSAPHLGANAIRPVAEIAGFIAGLADAAAATPTAAGGFDPPYDTFNLAMISGGTAANIVPNTARLVWDYRCLPDRDPETVPSTVGRYVDETVLPRLRAQYPGATIRTERHAGVPALAPDPDGPAETLARALTGANASSTVAFASEAGLFQQAGLSAVILGPGDIAVAHKPDEHITQAQMDEGLALLYRLADWAAAA